jgi:hypothetical protein
MEPAYIFESCAGCALLVHAVLRNDTRGHELHVWYYSSFSVALEEKDISEAELHPIWFMHLKGRKETMFIRSSKVGCLCIGDLWLFPKHGELYCVVTPKNHRP